MFEWKAFLDLAHALSTDLDNESALRTAVSRAYYAAFHRAKSYLARTDPHLHLPDHGASHELVPEHLKEHGRTRIEKGAARRLEELKRLRRWADYDRAQRARMKSQLQKAIKDAEFILEHLGDTE